MTTLQTAAQQALEALEEYQSKGAPFLACDGAITALRAALAQQDEPVQKPVAWLYEAGADRTLHWHKPPLYGTPLYLAPPRCPNCASLEAQNTELDRKLAELEQAYEAVYRAGQAHEREECAKLCEARFMGDMTREDMEARRCAAAIRARGNT